jgi:tripartite-type tricarboxylate transporter receptor subunit TctC
MVVPFAPGAAADTIARVVAERMQPKLGQPIIIENAGGADGSIGAGRVAHAAPDGYTLLAGPLNIHLASSASYDVVNDFEPIGLLAQSPMLLIVKKAIPANNLSEFIAWLKANPDKSAMGTAGAGSPPHLLGLLLRMQTGTQFDLVHYRGGGLAMLDIVAGHIDGMFISVAGALPQLASGMVKALGVAAQKRTPTAPEIPTMDEAGLREFYFSVWAGLFAPRERRGPSSTRSMPHPWTHWAILASVKYSRLRALIFRRRSSGPPRRCEPIKRPKSKDGRLSSKRPASKLSELGQYRRPITRCAPDRRSPDRVCDRA